MFHRPRIIPCLLLSGGDMVKTIRFQNPRYLGDPVNAVKIFNGKGVDELCVLDISATRQGQGPNLKLLHDIATEAFMPLSYGGGISSLEQIRTLIASGYEKIILNTALVQQPRLVQDAAAFAGSSSVVASIDVKVDWTGRKSCYICGGTRRVPGLSPAQLAKRAQELGAGEILLNAIHRDGLMTGYDLALIAEVAQAVSLPVIACGGAGSVSDLKAVLAQGQAHAAAAGSLFVYYGRQKAVLITAPSEDELIEAGIYDRED